MVDFIFTTKPAIGWVNGSATITGWVLWVILIPIVVTAQPFVRKRGAFQVVSLEIVRPSNWNFGAGDYVYLNIPVIARYEWHPFTISSAPEQKGSIWVHIRACGHWTNKLYKYTSERMKALSSANGAVATGADSQQRSGLFTKLVLRGRVQPLETTDVTVSDTAMMPFIFKTAYIRGPYGSPSGHMFLAEHAVLISTGIGVTPFASILQSMFYRFANQCFICPNCSTTCFQDPINAFPMNRVDFYWINRTQKEFEWFAQILRDLEDCNLAGTGTDDTFLGVHLFMTGAPKANDVRGVALQLALEIAYKKTKKDFLSGLRTRIETGRPDWRKEFEQLKARNKGKVTIFYCGIPVLGRTLQALANDYDFTFREEVF